MLQNYAMQLYVPVLLKVNHDAVSHEDPRPLKLRKIREQAAGDRAIPCRDTGPLDPHPQGRMVACFACSCAAS